LKPLISLDEDGPILHVTPLAAMLLKTRAAQLIGRPLSSLFAGIEARTQCVNRKVCATPGTARALR
jgi:nitrogen-specific signal transduction histidine kinase